MIYYYCTFEERKRYLIEGISFSEYEANKEWFSKTQLTVLEISSEMHTRFMNQKGTSSVAELEIDVDVDEIIDDIPVNKIVNNGKYSFIARRER